MANKCDATTLSLFGFRSNRNPLITPARSLLDSSVMMGPTPLITPRFDPRYTLELYCVTLKMVFLSMAISVLVDWEGRKRIYKTVKKRIQNWAQMKTGQIYIVHKILDSHTGQVSLLCVDNISSAPVVLTGWHLHLCWMWLFSAAHWRLLHCYVFIFSDLLLRHSTEIFLLAQIYLQFMLNR